MLSTSGESLSTVFAYELPPDIAWRAIFDADAVVRALGGTTTATAIAAGRWDDQAAFGLVTRIDLPDGVALLCALRHGVPFDAVELSGASAAAELLSMGVSDVRALAESRRETERHVGRAALLEQLLAALHGTRDASALLAQAVEEIARRMGAGATSIMLVEGNQLRVRATTGTGGAPLGHGQGVGEGIAGWVASRGEKVVLRGPIDDARFRGSDPLAGEAVIMPLRSGDEVIGVLNVKRPTGAHGFDEKLEVLDAIAGDVGRALSAVARIDTIEAERRTAIALEDVMRRAAANDAAAAARTTAQAFGHHAVAVRSSTGKLLGVHAEDDACRDAAVQASARVAPAPGGAVHVGVARHGEPYAPEEARVAAQAADALALLGHADVAAAKAPAIRVLAVEDHPVMRLGVRALLEREGLGIAGITATCTEAVDLVRESAPDVVLLDLSLPDASGVEAIERIRVAAPSVPIVAFSVDRSTDLIRSALRAGANGYVCKDAPAAHVVAALDAAARGLTALGSADAIALTRSPDTRPIVERPEEHVDVDAEEAAEPGAPVAVREPLTPRELELLRYLAEGYTNKEIARAMVLAEDTVKKGVQTLIAKLGATDRTHAVVLALRRRLIE